MKSLVYCFVIGCVFLFATCQSSSQTPSANTLKKEINNLDDSLKVMIDEVIASDDKQIDYALFEQSIEKNKVFYRSYPEDEFAEEAVHKIAAIYFQLEQEKQAAQWRDTLIEKYPNTKNIAGILELQMNFYDFNNFKPMKIKQYGDRLLKLENLPEDKREQIKFRLEHLDKNYEELIDYQIKQGFFD